MSLFDPSPLNRAVRDHALGEVDPTVQSSNPHLFGNSAVRGTQQSLGLGADYAGTLAETAGKDELAEQLYDYTDQQMHRGSRRQRGPQTLGDIRGVDSAVRYGVNKFAESASISAAAGGAALATGGASLPAQFAASSTAVMPVLAGETSYSMRQDEDSSATVGQRAAAATGAGLIGAGLEVLPELGVLNRVIGRGGAPAQTLREAVTRGTGTAGIATGGQAAVEVGQSVTSRTAQSLFNPDIAIDPRNPEARAEYLEAAAGGAAGGAGFGVPAGAYVTAAESAGVLAREAAAAPGGAARAFGEKTEGLRQKVGDMLTPGRPVEDPNMDIDGAVAAELEYEQTISEKISELTDLLRERADLTVEERSILEQETDLDPDAQAQVQELYDKKNREDAARAGVSRMQPEGTASRVNPDVPLSEVDDVVSNAAVETEAQSPMVRSWIATSRQFFEQGGQLDSPMINDALNIFGERGYTVLRQLTEGNPQAQEMIDIDQRQNGNLNNFMMQALKPEHRDTVTPAQLRQLRGMIMDAATEGVGDVNEILSAAFSNPQEVLDAISSNEVPEVTQDGDVTQMPTDPDDIGGQTEFGDTQAIEDTTTRLFGNTTKGRRIKTGDLDIGWPIPRTEVDALKKLTRDAETLMPGSALEIVPAHAELRRQGVDPADVAQEMGITIDQLRDMVFLQGQAPVDRFPELKKHVTKLRKRTFEQLNDTPPATDPNSGSYIHFKDSEGVSSALALRSYITSQVYGDRTPRALLDAMSEGILGMIEQGYILEGGLPGNTVLARYDRSGQETVVTIDDARKQISDENVQEAGETFPFRPGDFDVLAQMGIEPNVNPQTGELFLTEPKVVEIIERYAAALAHRNAQARGTPIPAWTQALIDKYGTTVPSELGRVSSRDSLMFDLMQWGIDNNVDSRALAAIVPDRRNRSRSRSQQLQEQVDARREAIRDRQGPAAVGGISDDRVADVAGAFGVQQLDPDTIPTQVLEEVGVVAQRDEKTKLSSERSKKAQEAADLIDDKNRVEKDRRPKKSFMDTMRLATNAVKNMQWSNTTLPSGVNLQGKYAVLGQLAASGEPLQFATAKGKVERKGADPESANKLVEAYKRRGFRQRTGKPMTVNIERNVYSDAVTSRVLGPDGQTPVHMVMTIGDTPTAQLANRVGIPVLDLTNPVQQKIAGDILRSYDRGRRQQVQNSSMSDTMKKAMLKGEERQGIDRVRDIVNAQIAKRVDAGMFNNADMQGLHTLAQIVHRADNDFFSLAIEGKSLKGLLADIDNLKKTFNAYQKEQGKASRKDVGHEIVADMEQFTDAAEYIFNVLPDDVRVDVSELPGLSGFYSEKNQIGDDGNVFVDKLIELSVYTADPMSVAFHESMHALIKALKDQPTQAPFLKALTKASNSPLVISQLREKLKDHPAAIEQINKDAEERIAYMYEFWAAGELNLASSVENWFTKLTDLIYQVLGILSNEQRAGLYMAAFHDGRLKDPSAVNDIVMSTLSGPERVLRASQVARKIAKIPEKMFRTAHGRLKAYGNPALDNIADAFFNPASSGYLQSSRSIVTMYGSQFGNIMRGMDPANMGELAAALHSQKAPADPDLRARYNQINQLMRRLHAYSRDAGLDVGRVENYFPQAWSKEAIFNDTEGFVQMLLDNAMRRDEKGQLVPFTEDEARGAADALANGRDQFDIQEDLAGYSPYMQASMDRQIVLNDRSLAVGYMDQDIVRVTTRYITQAAKRGEYTRHFGARGDQLKAWIAEARESGIDPADIETDISVAIRAMEGTLGHDINPIARSVMSGMVTVQNLAVLPLSVLSSLVDPMGIVVRGGTVEQAWQGFKLGVKNIPQSIRKNGTKSDMQAFAELVGTVEEQMVTDMLGDMYGSAFMSDWARKTNNLLFRYNLMEGWNTAVRSAATIAAVDFIERHNQNVDKKNSKRWLLELGATEGSLVFDDDGKLLWSQRDITDHMLATGGDISTAAEKSRFAREVIGRWVDGAVLRPQAAHRPAYGSDPRWMLIWHLKQFSYSFQKTILERVMHESKNGNYTPLLAVAAYVPFMIAADYLRAMIQGLGEEPDWRKNMTFGETVWHGTQRAGLLGIRQFGLDGADSPVFALGPTAGYMWKSTERVLDGEANEAIIAALPGNVIWKGWRE